MWARLRLPGPCVTSARVKSGDAHEVNHRTRILNTKYVLLIVMVMALPYPTGRVARKEECRGQACPRVCCATNPSYLYSSGLRPLWSDVRHINLSLARALLKLICLIQVCTVCSTYLYLLCIRAYSLEVCTVCSVYSPGMQSILARYAGVKSASSLVLHRGAINT